MSNVIREIAVDMEDLARDILVCPHQWVRAELVMEVYRHIVTTGTERGTRWRKNDPWSHARYPNFSRIVGRAVDGAYEDLYFALDDSMTAEANVARVIARAVLGKHPTLARWRRDQGSMSHARIPVRLRRAQSERWVDLRALLSEPVGRRLTVQYNSVHDLARIVHRVLLIPQPEGWTLGVEYGCSDDPRGMQRHRATSSWVAQQSRAHGDDPQRLVPVQRDKEPTSLFVRRCADYVSSITVPHA